MIKKTYQAEEVIELLDETSRFAEFGKISASVLHEISSPVTAALLNLEQADAESINNAKDSLLQLNKYIHAARNQLRGYSSHRDFSLIEEAKEIKRVILPLANSMRSKVVFSSVPKVIIAGDPVKFQQLMINLIVNAMESYRDKVAPLSARSVSVRFSLEGPILMITVEDAGQGIPSKGVDRIFDPFYSSKSKSGNGLGLGMLIVRRNVEEIFKGTIGISSKTGKGTKVTIKIPFNSST